MNDSTSVRESYGGREMIDVGDFSFRQVLDRIAVRAEVPALQLIAEVLCEMHGDHSPDALISIKRGSEQEFPPSKSAWKWYVDSAESWIEANEVAE